MRRSRKRRKALRRQSALLAALALPTAGMVLALAAWTYSDYREAIESARRDTKSFARVLERNVDRVYLDLAHRMDEAILKLRPRLLQGELHEREIHAVLKELTSHINPSHQISLADSSGKLRALNHRFPAPGLDVSSMQGFRHHLGKPAGELQVYNSSWSPVDGRWLAGVSRAIGDRQGRLLGVVGSSIDIGTFQEFYRSLQLPHGAVVTIARLDGRILFRHPHHRDLVARGARVPSYVLSSVKSRDMQEVDRERSPFDGRSKIGHAIRLRNFPMLVFVGFDRDSVLAPWRKATLFRFLLLATSMAVIGGFATAFYRKDRQIRLAEEERKRENELIRLIHQGTESKIGTQFLDALVSEISRVMGFPIVMIAELASPGGSRARTRALSIHGRTDEARELELRDSACAQVFKARSAVHFNGARHAFPEDSFLRANEIESFLGIPLGNGILVALDRRATVFGAIEQNVLGALAARASAELDRLRTETLRSEAEALKAQIEDRARQSQKLEAIGTLAGGIAHDFNNILTIMMGHIFVALEDAPKGGALEDSLLRISTACQRGTKLVKQILAFGRKGQRETQLLDLRSSVMEASELLSSTLPSKVSLDVSFPEDADPGLWVMADPNQLLQVLMNLCTNALQAMSDGGGTLSISVAREGDQIRLSVADTGPGIALELRSRIFEPFFTTKQSGRGTGLGLSVVLGIVQDHRGTIDFESAPGKGTRFDVRFPALPRIEAPADGKPKRVLLIDDEEAVVGNASNLLSRAGFEVDGFTDASEALQRFLGDPSGYSALITDQNMPGIAGHELAREARRACSSIPIFVYSAANPAELQAILRDQPGVHILPKPMDLGRVLNSLEAAGTT